MDMTTGFACIAILGFWWGGIRFLRFLHRKDLEERAEYRKDPRYAAGQAAARKDIGYFQSKQGSVPFRLGFDEEKARMKAEERAAHRAWCEEHGDYDD